MHTVKHFVIRDMNDVEPGELIAFDLGGPAIGIASHKSDAEDKLRIIVLNSIIEARHPCWTDLTVDGYVLSYGKDWVLDLGRADGYTPGNYDGADAPGTISVSGMTDRLLLRVGADGQTIRHRAQDYELSSFRGATGSPDPSSTIYIHNWSIWHSEAERQRQGGSPIFVFSR